jgi:hypothetical protein
VRRHAANKTKLSSGTVWFRRCKGLRLIARPRGNEDSINRSREGKTNFVVHVDLKIVVRHPITSELPQSVKPGRSR